MGVEFIQLNKRDSGLNRFVSGTANGARNMTFLEELRSKRSAATIAAVAPAAPAGEVLFDQAPTKAAQKKRRTEAVGKDLPSVVTVDLPRIQGEDGETRGPVSIKLRPGVDATSNVWMEIRPDALEYLRLAMALSAPAERKCRTASSGGGRWRPDRKRFIAQRPSSDEGKMITRSFKPDDPDSEESREQALALAKAWVVSGDSDAEGAAEGAAEGDPEEALGNAGGEAPDEAAEESDEGGEAAEC